MSRAERLRELESLMQRPKKPATNGSKPREIDMAIDRLRDAADRLEAAVGAEAEARRGKQKAILDFNDAIGQVNMEAQKIVNRARMGSARIDRELAEIHIRNTAAKV